MKSSRSSSSSDSDLSSDINGLDEFRVIMDANRKQTQNTLPSIVESTNSNKPMQPRQSNSNMNIPQSLIPNFESIIPQKRHRDIDQMSNMNNSNNSPKRRKPSQQQATKKQKTLCNELKNILQHFWTNKERTNLNQMYTEPAMIKLVSALIPEYSLGAGYNVCDLPSVIPNYPKFTNNTSTNYHIGVGQNYDYTQQQQTQRQRQERPICGVPKSSLNYVTSQWQQLDCPKLSEWKRLEMNHKALIWNKVFDEQIENYVHKMYTKQKINKNDRISAKMVSAQLQINILYALHSIERNKEETNNEWMKNDLFSYYVAIGKGLEIWQKFIECGNFEKHVIDYLIECLLVTAHGFLVHGMLTLKMTNNRIKAREDFIKCIRRIRRVHRHSKVQNMHRRVSDVQNNDGLDDAEESEMGGDNEDGKECDDRRYEFKQFHVSPSFNVAQINAKSLNAICSEWNWFHADLNKTQWHNLPNYDANVFNAEIGPYDTWIIEAYWRIATLSKDGSIQKFNCLHKALKLCRNKDGFGQIVSIRILIDYAYTFLERRECNLLDNFYWFYLNILSFGLLHMSKHKKIICDDELFNLQSRFLCGCIMNKLCSQTNYKRFLRKFIKENMSKSRTDPKKAIVRFLKIAYVAINHGVIDEANNFYRSARALTQYYMNLENKNCAIYAQGQRLMDSFEIWWNFHWFCVKAISAISAHCVINCDSSYFMLLWDMVTWRCQCSKMMMECAKMPRSKYYGYCEEYVADKVNLAYFCAQAMILGIIHCSKKMEFYPNDKYLYTIQYLLDIAKQSDKFKEHCFILSLFVKKQFKA